MVRKYLIKLWLLLVLTGLGLGQAASCGIFLSPLNSPVAIDAAAPEFSLSDQQGNTVTLASLIQDGPALLLFYRGHW